MNKFEGGVSTEKVKDKKAERPKRQSLMAAILAAGATLLAYEKSAEAQHVEHGTLLAENHTRPQTAAQIAETRGELRQNTELIRSEQHPTAAITTEQLEALRTRFDAYIHSLASPEYTMDTEDGPVAVFGYYMRQDHRSIRYSDYIATQGHDIPNTETAFRRTMAPFEGHRLSLRLGFSNSLRSDNALSREQRRLSHRDEGSSLCTGEVRVADTTSNTGLVREIPIEVHGEGRNLSEATWNTLAGALQSANDTFPDRNITNYRNDGGNYTDNHHTLFVYDQGSEILVEDVRVTNVSHQHGRYQVQLSFVPLVRSSQH